MNELSDTLPSMDQIIERAISLLRRDGRASYSEIARQLGTSRVNIASRLGPSLESGSVRVIAAVHPRLLGLNVLAHASIRVSGPLDPVIEAVANLTTPVFVSETAGQYQLVCELHARDLHELQVDLRQLRSAPGVLEADVILYERMLSSFFLGEEPAQFEHGFDEHDLRIIDLLQVDGRMSYSDIAEEVGLSISAARARVTRLLETGAMQIGVVRGRNAASSELVFGFGFKLTGDEHALLTLLSKDPGLEFLARTVGRFSVVATLAFPSLSDFNDLLARLREVESVHTVEPWLHAAIRLERYHHGAHGLAAANGDW
ncbi:Lrp/AsnC family transcriptional regulator [Leucobacter sp. W1478]|uniref:Lrp/AsnC family transcriptional regulator n=1 Tax=Leucobacter sp. W1478 TaxID=3439065 RepID=UPI003F39213F